ncbi:MAG: UbiD family decarboxylase [Salinigranum sp.]
MSTHVDPRFDSLRDYLSYVDEQGLLKHIEGADWNDEIGSLTEVVAFADDPKALVFDSIEGYPEGYRVATNLYVTERMQAIALGLDEEASGIDLVNEWREKSVSDNPLPPEYVEDGPIRENVQSGSDVDLLSFPVPLWRSADGGRYFGTGDGVITRDPEDGWVNVAPYRCQVHDESTLGIYINQVHHGRIHMKKFWDRGEDAPVVITGVQDPYVYAASCTQLPSGYPELEFAGGLKGEPIEVIEHEETGLPVPAHAEIAVIGHVPPPEEETRLEGPFGECTGYYAGTMELPVVHVDEIWHRNDPILQGSPTMMGPTRKFALGAQIVTSARIWDSIADDIPAVEGVYALYQQCQAGSDITVISIEQQYAGHAKQAAVEVLGAYPNVIMNNMVIAVDEDIDPANVEEVLFALTTRCDMDADIDVITGLPSIGLDVRIPEERKQAGELTSASMVVDACKPYHWKDEFAKTNIIDDERKREIIEKWNVDEWA